MVGLKFSKYSWPVVLWIDNLIGLHAAGFRQEKISQLGIKYLIIAFIIIQMVSNDVDQLIR